jgi:hypothetical protein
MSGVKLTKAQARLNNALQFLADHSDSMRTAAPPGKGDEYAAAHWRPMAPSYSWSKEYGDFQIQTIRAGEVAGLIEEKRPGYHEYRITPKGRAHLAALSEDAALLADGNSRYSAAQRETITEAGRQALSPDTGETK